MSDTLTKIEFLNQRNGTPSDPLGEPLTLLFDPEPHGFAIGTLRKIRDWVPKGIVAGSQQLHVISSISVSSQDGVIVYTVTASELFGNHVLILTGRFVSGDPCPPESTYWLREAQGLSEHDPRIERAVGVLAGPQRQDSRESQMQDAEALISAAGLQDALRWIHEKTTDILA